jgi:hypothetical protein
MSKNTMLYGLLIAGGLLAYFAWKKKSADLAKSSETASNSTSGTFVDDVPVSQEVADELLQGTGGVKPPKTIKNTLSQIVEPLIGTKQQVELSGKGQFLES